MHYVIAVKGNVYGTQSAFLAYQLTEEILLAGHHISQIFFFQNGVNNGNRFVEPANDEVNLMEKWQKLAKTHRLSLHLCISAAQRRGIVPDSLANGFTLAGLGEFSQALLTADRLLTL